VPKAPAFQFYVKDWLSDTDLQMASSSTRGIWINALCYMWGGCNATCNIKGKLSGTKEELAKLLRAVTHEFDLFLGEAERLKFADVTICNNVVTIINRRMLREQKIRENTRLRVRKFRSNIKSNIGVTPLSPSPSPIKEKIKPLHEKEISRPHVREFIDFYFQEFKGRFKIEPIIEGGKDGKLVKNLLEKIDLNELKILLLDFLDSDDPFIQKSGYTIGAFKSQIQKLRIKPPLGKSLNAANLWLNKEEKHDEERQKKISYGINENESGSSRDES